MSYEKRPNATNRLQREVIAETDSMESDELKVVLEQHHPSSFGWAMACCRRDPSEAEEVLQIVYLKVLQGKARFNGTASFKTWLFAVIRKTASDQRRRSLLRALTTLRVAQQRATDLSEHPEESTYRSELQSMFLSALARLPRRQREVLELVFYHDLNIQEAAAVMSVSLGSARTHYERGKKRLRQLLEESEALYESEWRRTENPATVP
jgi:RNA polymerase sigma factor (sigma-70 family)